jgi:lysophospholipase L1-like esterase
MKIKEKLMMDINGLSKHGAITIVVVGDSVSHGMFAADEVDYESVYHYRLAKKLHAVRNYVPVNVINASIGGTTAHGALARLEKQVLSHSPDLVIVGFGLNDINGPLQEYLSSLEEIFTRSLATGADVIFLTPNMLNTYVYTEGVAKENLDYAKVTAEFQTNGRMDEYMQAATTLAKECGVAVADCYSAWKELSKTQDTTKLLANYINHPTREMHELFANTIFDIIMENAPDQN